MAVGDILREFIAPAEAQGNGRAIAFDGTNLYLTVEGKAEIYKVTTTGTFLQTIPTTINYGALQYDSKENVLWAGNYTGNFEIYKIDLNGNVLFSFNYQSYVDPADPFPDYVDGVTVDQATDTLYFSTDAGFTVYNVTKTGQFISKFSTPPSGSAQNGANSGLASDSDDLWLAFVLLFGSDKEIVQTDLSGNVLARFPTTNYNAEDIEYDPITFAPKCVLWSNEATGSRNRIRAWEITCGSEPCPFDDLITAIANQEAGLASLTQIEVNKLNKLLSLVNDIDNLNKVNDSIERFLKLLIKKEIILELLLGEALEGKSQC